MELVPFESWPDVLAYARSGRPLYYQAPMDRFATVFFPGAKQERGYEARGRTIKMWPPGSVGRGRQRDADPFSADSGHLDRFSRPAEGKVESSGVARERRGRRVAADPSPEEIGQIGDVNFAEHGGGLVFRRPTESGRQTDIYGDCFLEYIEPPSDDQDFDEPGATWTVYRVDLDPNVPDWGDLKAVATTTDQDPKDLKTAFSNTDPMQRAWAYETWASYYGWNEFDNYPLTLTCAEMNKRYNANLDCGGDDEDE